MHLSISAILGIFALLMALLSGGICALVMMAFLNLTSASMQAQDDMIKAMWGRGDYMGLSKMLISRAFDNSHAVDVDAAVLGGLMTGETFKRRNSPN